MRRGGSKRNIAVGRAGPIHSLSFFGFGEGEGGGRNGKWAAQAPAAARPFGGGERERIRFRHCNFFFAFVVAGPPFFHCCYGKSRWFFFVAQFFFALSDPPLLHRGRRCFPPLFGDRRRKRGALSAFLIASRWGRKGTPPPHSCAKAHFKRSRRKRGGFVKGTPLSRFMGDQLTPPPVCE